MKKGFTLVELLIVVVLMAVISTSSIIAFDNIDNDTNETDKVNMYKNVQRSATLYVDLNDDWLNQFMTNKEIFISIGELKNTNYINPELEDPVYHEDIPSNYLVKLYMSKDEQNNEYIDSCVLDSTKLNTKNACVANSDGEEDIACCANCVLNTDLLSEQGKSLKDITFNNGTFNSAYCLTE